MAVENAHLLANGVVPPVSKGRGKAVFKNVVPVQNQLTPPNALQPSAIQQTPL
jgi:hypothetical protein